MPVDLDELERMLGGAHVSAALAHAGRMAIDELRRRRFAEALEGSTLERDDPTPVDRGLVTVRIGEERSTFDGVKYHHEIRRGSDVWHGRGDCESCAEANAVGERLENLRDRCTEDKRVMRRSFKETT